MPYDGVTVGIVQPVKELIARLPGVKEVIVATNPDIGGELTATLERLAGVMMKHTTTLGIRRQDMDRYVLRRSEETVSTPYGEVRVKRAEGMGVERSKPEFDDLAAKATEKDLSLEAVRKGIR